MKIILTIVIALCASSAFAVDFECKNQVSATRTEGARISSWPYFMVIISFNECTIGDNSGQCSAGMEQIANPYQVCYTDVNVNQDCLINETASSVKVACNNGSTMNFEIDASSFGKITCLENGTIRKTWNVGTCNPN